MLTSRQIRFLRSLAHHRHPVVRIGRNGLSEAVIAELEVALSAHELVKIQLAGADRGDRDERVRCLCESTGAQPVQRIGHTATLFRRNGDKPVIDLPEPAATPDAGPHS